MSRYDGFRAPWWPYEQPKCETCGQYHTMVCPIEREAAAKRVRLKRAQRRYLADACSACGLARIEHADPAVDHAFKEPTA